MAEGNTKPPPIKQETQRIYWCFTMYPNDIEILETVESSLNLICKKWIFGIETCPTTGKKHLQGFMHLLKKMRRTQISLPFNPHLEPCKGDEAQNVKYCSKEGNVRSFGFPPPLVVIKECEFNTFQKMIVELFLGPVDKRKVYWFWDPIGGCGKSDICKYLVHRYNILFCNGGKSSDLINLVFNTEAIPAMIWDMPRDTTKISFNAIESIKNGMVCNTKYETGIKLFNPPHIFILSNNLPEDFGRLSADRWVVYKIDNRGSDVSLMNFDKKLIDDPE